MEYIAIHLFKPIAKNNVRRRVRQMPTANAGISF